MGITKMRFSVQRRLLRMLKYGREPRHCRPVSTATRRITWGEHDDECDNKDGQNGRYERPALNQALRPARA
jgi:hypothetical protein